MNNLLTVLQSMRLPFLLLTPICVLLGSSYIHYLGMPVDILLLTLVLIGATLSHISVNMINEYLDFASGLDLHTDKTPFSGGSGALPANPSMASAVLYTGVSAITLTILIGVYFVWIQGATIVPVGVLGVLIIVTYTQWLNRLPLVCLVAPGIGFGVLMVVGTTIILSGQVVPATWMIAVSPFMLVNNLLLLNQLPDIDADRAAGRRHFPIAYGVRSSIVIYTVFSACAYISIIYPVVTGALPALSLIALLTIPLAVFAIRGGYRHGKNIGSHPVYLAANVATSLLTPALLAVSLFLS